MSVRVLTAVLAIGLVTLVVGWPTVDDEDRPAPGVVPRVRAALESWTPAPEGTFRPPWADLPIRAFQRLQPDPRLPARERGEMLRAAVKALRPGDQLELGGGRYEMVGFWNISLAGQPGSPIRIVARPGERVEIFRKSTAYNLLDVGTPSHGPARFLEISGIVFSGGSIGIRLHRCRNIWIDRCEIQQTDGPALTANTAPTSALFLTRNLIHHTAGTGEGLYLGAHDGKSVMSRSVIALNRIHHCGGSQGDGIEVKQGSWGNRIVGNDVRDTRGPCLILYGTAGRKPNVLEDNLCLGSGDNVVQVQGEAIVRRNLIVDGLYGLHTHDHVGKTRDLIVTANTIITTADATDLESWDRRPGMVFTGNVVFSEHGKSLRFGAGSVGVEVAANAVFGPTLRAPRGAARQLTGFEELGPAVLQLGALPPLGPRAPRGPADPR